jgi:hypothetical protein
MRRLGAILGFGGNVKHLVLLLIASVLALGCNADPLRPVPARNTDEPFDAVDDPAPVDPEDPADPADPAPGDPVDPIPTSIDCVDGSDGSSWRDALPALPLPIAVPNQLTIDDQPARFTCTGDPVGQTTGESWEDLFSQQLHVGGQWYGEVTIQVYGDGGVPSIGVFAYPAEAYQLIFGASFFDDLSSVAGQRPNTAGTIGIAADLDAGLISFYGNGVLTEQIPVSLIPGVGGYAMGVAAAPSNVIQINYGSAPFTYAPPPGFAAWSSDENGGPCDSASAVPAPAAAVTASNPDGYGLTTFLASVPNDVELVVLGAYDTGGVAGWTWDENGNQVDTGDFQRGSVRVQVRRPGRIALVLSAYEPTDWSVEVGPDTQLEVVMARGMHPPTVTGVPAGVTVDLNSICTDGAGGSCDGQTGANFPVAPHTWPFDYGGGDTQGFIDYVEAELCLPLSIFGGIYSTQSFVVN